MNCYVCKKPRKDDELYGEKRTLQDIKCHYFCLLFAHDIPQNGEDDEGISGFKYPDIIAGVALKSKTNCFYCKKPYASAKCSKKSCQKKYHFTCGITKGCLFEFTGDYKSYCSLHTGIPQMPPKEYDEKRTCTICTERMGKYSPLECIPAHCIPTSYMHRKCLRGFALRAGHGLKCLICRDPSFRTFAEKRGIYVPQREIEWMLNQCEGGSQDPSAPPLMCGAKICKFKHGRHFPLNTTVGATCDICKRPFHTCCTSRFSIIKRNNLNVCFDCYDEDTQDPEEPMIEEKNTNLVPVENQENLQMKCFLADAYAEKTNHVSQDVLPNFYGPRAANHGKFRLNYFFNSFQD
ncbi:hypothetical protein DMENIID0001_050940 [Sergentomyia squamirostris]